MDGYVTVRMEDFGARDREADDFCRQKVAECDVFVGLIGHLHGSCPLALDEIELAELAGQAAGEVARLAKALDRAAGAPPL